MNLNEEGKEAVRELGDAINSAIESSVRVSDAIENLRKIGYEPNLNLRLEIGLQDISANIEHLAKDFEPQEIELELTDEDLKTLRRMKIRFDSE